MNSLNINDTESSGRKKLFYVVTTIKSLEEAIAAYGAGTDIIELRLDLVEHGKTDEKFFKSFSGFAEKSKKPIITTCRLDKEGGLCREDDQIGLFEKSLHFSDYLDIELRSKNIDVIKGFCKDFNKKLIVSYHDFEKTPSKNQIENIIDKCAVIGDISKVAFMPNDINDVFLLEEITIEYSKKNIPIVSISMGDMGKISRICLPFYGSMFTYAYAGEEKAPGQIYIKDLKNILRILEVA